MRVIILCFMFAISAPAQSLTTNYVKGPDYIRVVEGKFYNIEKSTNWADIYGTCIKTATNGILVRTDPYKETFRSDSLASRGNFLGVGRASISEPPKGVVVPYDAIIVLRHFPTNEPAFDGAKIRIRAMYKGLVMADDGASRLQDWDCGLPYLVPVVRTNKPPPPTPK